MLYADWDYYTGVYGGNLDGDCFFPAARDASAYIDRLTYGRLKQGAPVTDEVRMAVCAVAEVIAADAARNQLAATGVKSETVAGHSVTYEDRSTAARQLKNNMRAAANLYLSPSDPLRYAGV